MKNKGRYSILTHTYCFLANALLSLPAFSFISCDRQDIMEASQNRGEIIMDIVPSGLSLSSDGGDTVDIFVFEGEGLMRLDSYQKMELKAGNISFAASGHGKKRIVAILNSHRSRYSWTDVSSYYSLTAQKALISHEKESGFLMYGEGEAEAGDGAVCSIEVSPFVSEIKINSIGCDFRGKPYDGKVLENVKAYLINVSSEVTLIQQDIYIPTSYINMFCLNQQEMDTLDFPGMLYQEIPVPVGKDTVFPDISLYCYPNGCGGESPGSPFTRLVIEGEIDGMKCFYPVSINRHGHTSGAQGKGIGRNCRYIYDITIKSMGTSDPDIEAGLSDICIACLIAPWNEESETGIVF